jgi:selenocysteine lyase/cysteine desulfurase
MDSLPTYKLRPASDRFETGTGNFEGYAGARAAVEYIASVGRAYGSAFADRFSRLAPGRRRDSHAGMAAIRTYEMGLFGRLLDGLEAIPGVRVWGITDRARMEERTPTAAITLGATTAEAAATRLGERGIATWWGDFYAVGPVEALGLQPEGVLRIGLTHYNTTDEVDRLLAELREIAAS